MFFFNSSAKFKSHAPYSQVEDPTVSYNTIYHDELIHFKCCDNLSGIQQP